MYTEVAELGFEPGPKPELLLLQATAWKALHGVVGLFPSHTDATKGSALGVWVTFQKPKVQGF